MGKLYLQGEKVVLNSDAVVVIKVLDARFLRIVSWSLILAVALLTFSFFMPFLKGSIISEFNVNNASGSINVDVLNSIIHDLGEEGFLKKEDKALIMSPLSSFEGATALLNWNNEVDVVMNESYDFVFTPSFEDAVFADHFLKINGIVAFPLKFDPSNAGFRKQSNYRFVYLKRYGSIFVALRKIGVANNNLVYSSPKRKLCQFATDAKTIALRGLEDADLNEENKAAIEWFQRNYPKKNAKLHIHSHVVPPKDHAQRTENKPKKSTKFHIHSHVNKPKKSTKFHIHSHVVAPRERVLQTDNYPKMNRKFQIHSHVVAPKNHVLQTENYPKKSTKLHIHSHVVAPN